MSDWLQNHTELLVGLGTVALAVFGALQIVMELVRRRAERTAARAQLLGPAWLARRSLESALSEALGRRSAVEWFEAVGTSKHLDPLEAHLLSAIRVAAGAKGKESKTVRAAFEEFLAYADNLNHIGAVQPSLRDAAGFLSAYSDAERADINQAARAALTHLRAAIAQLSIVVPRRAGEPELPRDDELPLLTGSPTP